MAHCGGASTFSIVVVRFVRVLNFGYQTLSSTREQRTKSYPSIGICLTLITAGFYSPRILWETHCLCNGMPASVLEF
jgi:hypothetical protein